MEPHQAVLDVGARTVCVDCRGTAEVVRIALAQADGMVMVARVAFCARCGPERVWGFQVDAGPKQGSAN